jgi:hypothetical protein
MERILRLTLNVIKAGGWLRRLPNQYQRKAALCRIRPWLFDFQLRHKSMLVALLFWGANCAAQGLVMASAFAQPSDAPMIAAGLKTMNGRAGVPFASESFSDGASPTRPSLLISMTEEGGSIDRRFKLRMLAAPSLDQNDGSNPVSARPSPTTASDNITISARESVSLYRPTELAPPARALENASSVDAGQTRKAFDKNESRYSLLFWPKQGSLAWPNGDDFSRKSTTSRIAGGLPPGENPTHFAPLLSVA